VYKYCTLLNVKVGFIITYLKAGAAAAERLTPQATGFTDVPVEHWASKYVAYAVKTGIISGRNPTTFDPSTPITGTEIAKLLLGALGYGVNGEYVGDRWAISAVADASRVGILFGNDIDLNAPALREEVIQYVFNTLKPNGANGKNFIVEYNEYIHQYIVSGTSSQNGVGNVGLDSYIGGRYFDLSKQVTTDDLGVGQREWKIKNKVVTDKYLDDVLLAETVTLGKYTLGDLYLLAVNNDAGWDFTTDIFTINTYAPLWWNGEDYTNTFIHANLIPGTYVSSIKKGNPDPLTTAAGLKIALYDNSGDGNVDKVVITSEYLAKVTKVDAKTDTVNIAIYDQDNGGALGVERNVTGVDAKGFALNDYVVVIPKSLAASPYNWYNGATGTQILTIKKAETVVGKVSNYTRSNTGATIVLASATIDGTKYNFASLYAFSNGKPATTGAPTFTANSTLYLDSNGFVVGWSGEAATKTNYLVVTAYHAEEATAFKAASFKVAAIYAETGKSAILDLAVYNGTGGYTGSKVAKLDGVEYDAFDFNDLDGITGNFAPFETNDWYLYTTNDAGIVTLTGITSTYVTGVDDLGVTPGTNPYASMGTTGTVNASTTVGAPSGQYFYQNTKTLLYAQGAKYTGYTGFPQGLPVFKYVLVVGEYRTGAFLPDAEAIFGVGGTAATAKAALFAVIADEPYDAGFAEAGVTYAVYSPNAALQTAGAFEKGATSTAHEYHAGDVVDVELVDGVYVISDYRSNASTGLFDASTGGVPAMITDFDAGDKILRFGAGSVQIAAATIVYDLDTGALVDDLADLSFGRYVLVYVNATTYAPEAIIVANSPASF
jgi:hypothetical protein